MLAVSLLLLAVVRLAQCLPQFGLPQPGMSESAVTSGRCFPVTFIYAKGSTDYGNMGTNMGPVLCSGLRRSLGNTGIGCQGVGGGYSGSLTSNMLPSSTDQRAINEAKRMFTLAAQRCPKTSIVSAGYSQGTAVLAGAVADLASNVKDQIRGVVLFGYTRNRQNNGGIPRFPSSRVKVFCNFSDTVCQGTLIMTPGHFSYKSDGDTNTATRWMVSQVKAAASQAQQ